MRFSVPLCLLTLMLCGCAAQAEYPSGVTSNVARGASSNINALREGSIDPQVMPEGQNAVCVGAWCSCESGE